MYIIEGDAEQTIQLCLTLAALNYKSVYEILKDRFVRKERIMFIYWFLSRAELETTIRTGNSSCNQVASF